MNTVREEEEEARSMRLHHQLCWYIFHLIRLWQLIRLHWMTSNCSRWHNEPAKQASLVFSMYRKVLRGEHILASHFTDNAEGREVFHGVSGASSILSFVHIIQYRTIHFASSLSWFWVNEAGCTSESSTANHRAHFTNNHSHLQAIKALFHYGFQTGLTSLSAKSSGALMWWNSTPSPIAWFRANETQPPTAKI